MTLRPARAPGPGAAIPSLPDLAYAHLQAEILSGALPPGAPLRQEDIATRLAISRLPVREALARLEADGLAVLRPRRGYIVTDLDADEIVDLCDIRAMLEERAGFLATQRRTQEDVAALTAILEEIDTLDADGGIALSDFAERNLAFHERLFAPCARPRLIRLMATLRGSVDRYARMTAAVAGSLGRAQPEHWLILDAYRAGDATEVGRLCRAHVEGTAGRLISALEKLRMPAG
ncbi:GntR family transcriptional regulator [Stella humosa]|uniref:GntR family transcriptional regulator n=1 Tax=Stella humosa TaxID=94 RepID=A0A3N1LDC9_9PROT|nr:GntR family transcriptional regulator [Stella humosa]ROP91081.1 GntR family transcriptional regulator [Stella humosa]BBK34569.1 GntR family transcriptional regulator [Stella humosa]